LTLGVTYSGYENLQYAGYGPLEERGIKLFDLSGDVQVKIPTDLRFQEFKVAKLLTEADIIINVPVMKTHCICAVTLGVKNLFGFLSTKSKNVFHDLIYEVTLDLNRRFTPDLTIMDGIVGAETWAGEVQGKPKNMGVVLAGTDTFAVDITSSMMMGFEPDKLHIFKLARAMGLINFNYDDLVYLGDDPESLKDPFINQRGEAQRIIDAILGGERSVAGILSIFPEGEKQEEALELLKVIEKNIWCWIEGDRFKADIEALKFHYDVVKKAY